MGSPMVPLKHEFKKYSFKKTLKIYFLSRTLEIHTTFKQTSKKTSLDKSGLFLTREQFCILVRATNSKLLGTKILELSKTFRVELENT